MTSCHATHHLCLCDKVVCVSTCVHCQAPIKNTQQGNHKSSLPPNKALSYMKALFIHSEVAWHWKPSSLRDCSALGARLSQ